MRDVMMRWRKKEETNKQMNDQTKHDETSNFVHELITHPNRMEELLKLGIHGFGSWFRIWIMVTWNHHHVYIGECRILLGRRASPATTQTDTRYPLSRFKLRSEHSFYSCSEYVQFPSVTG